MKWTVKLVAEGQSSATMAAVLCSFVMSCERVKIDPWAWFRDGLTLIDHHPIAQLDDLLPHRWKPASV